MTAPFAVAGAAVGAAGAIVGLPGPRASDGRKADVIAQLRQLPPGPAFDAAFIQASIMGHEEAYDIHGSYARSGDPGLRRVARSALPLIRLHLSQLHRLERSVGT